MFSLFFLLSYIALFSTIYFKVVKNSFLPSLSPITLTALSISLLSLFQQNPSYHLSLTFPSRCHPFIFFLSTSSFFTLCTSNYSIQVVKINSLISKYFSFFKIVPVRRSDHTSRYNNNRNYAAKSSKGI